MKIPISAGASSPAAETAAETKAAGISPSWDGGVNESAIAANGSPYGNPDAPDGSQVLAIEGNATAWQDVTFSEAGNYTLSFLAAYTNANQGWNWFNGTNPIAVQIDGVTVGTFTPGSNDHFDAYQTDSFAVTPAFTASRSSA